MYKYVPSAAMIYLSKEFITLHAYRSLRVYVGLSYAKNQTNLWYSMTWQTQQ